MNIKLNEKRNVKEVKKSNQTKKEKLIKCLKKFLKQKNLKKKNSKFYIEEIIEKNM